MNAISAIILEVNKNGRYYNLMIPISASYEEAEEVSLEMIQQIKLMASNDPRNKPAQDAPVVDEVKPDLV